MKLVTTNEVLRELCICRTTLYKWRKQGLIRSYRPEGRIRIVYFDLDEVRERLKGSSA